MQEITKNILEKLETLRDKINENVEYMILKYDLSNNKTIGIVYVLLWTG